MTITMALAQIHTHEYTCICCTHTQSHAHTHTHTHLQILYLHYMQTAPMDYVSLNKTLTFSQETTVTTFNVFIVNDTVLEGTEQFFVSLKTLDSRVNLDPSRVPVRILDDDGKQNNNTSIS